VDVPYIIRNENGYGLEFTLPLAEIDDARLGEVDHEKSELFARQICEKHGAKPHISYPKLRWDGKELKGMALGDNCACVGSEVMEGRRTYYFHNIDFSWQALAALEFLASYANLIRKRS
jgi:hypothetical protein